MKDCHPNSPLLRAQQLYKKDRVVFVVIAWCKLTETLKEEVEKDPKIRAVGVEALRPLYGCLSPHVESTMHADVLQGREAAKASKKKKKK